MAPWKGKWALVTGASAGIGAELARQLAGGGVNVVLTARRTERLTHLAGELTARHQVQAVVCPADLSRPEAPEELFRFTQEKGLAVEILVNNAGFGYAGEFHKQDRHRLLDMVQVNVTSVVNLTHLYAQAMAERGSGYILIVSSVAAFQAVPYLGNYAATKGFELLFSESISEELRNYGVRVTCLCPGSTRTEFHQVAGRPATGAQAPAEKVAHDGLKALAAGKSLAISGLGNHLAMEAQRLVPRRLVSRVVGWMYHPPA